MYWFHPLGFFMPGSIYRNIALAVKRERLRRMRRGDSNNADKFRLLLCWCNWNKQMRIKYQYS
jgi:hypothetical protein